MSKEAIKGFTEKVKKDPALLQELKTRGTMQEVVALAKENGFAITLDDLKDVKETYAKPGASKLEDFEAGRIDSHGGRVTSDCATGYCPWGG